MAFKVLVLTKRIPGVNGDKENFNFKCEYDINTPPSLFPSMLFAHFRFKIVNL